MLGTVERKGCAMKGPLSTGREQPPLTLVRVREYSFSPAFFPPQERHESLGHNRWQAFYTASTLELFLKAPKSWKRKSWASGGYGAPERMLCFSLSSICLTFGLPPTSGLERELWPDAWEGRCPGLEAPMPRTAECNLGCCELGSVHAQSQAWSLAHVGA